LSRGNREDSTVFSYGGRKNPNKRGVNLGGKKKNGRRGIEGEGYKSPKDLFLEIL